MIMEDVDEEILSRGNPVMKQLPSDDPTDKLSGKAICVQDINAPKDAVWNQILDLDSYVGKVNKVKECKNYYVKDNGDGTVRIKTKMVLGVMPGYSVRFVYAIMFQRLETLSFSFLFSNCQFSVLFAYIWLHNNILFASVGECWMHACMHAVYQLLRPLFPQGKRFRHMVFGL